MILLIDFGNTSIKASITALDKYNEIDNFKGLEDAFIFWLQNHLQKIEQYCISSVLTEHKTKEIIKLLNDNGIQSILWSKNKTLPIQINYNTPETLGQDRICGAIGAHSLYPNQNILIIDAGTCIKYDFVTNNKSYQGGAISLGISMRFKALNHYTNLLPLLNKPEIVPEIIGKSTQTAIESGVINGVIGEILYCIAQYKEKNHQLQVVFTGGDAKYLHDNIKNTIFANRNLVLLGLFQIAKYRLTIK